MNFEKILLKNIFLSTLIFISFALGEDIIPPIGGVRNITMEDFLPHRYSDKDFNETWSYQFFFDNGTRAFVNYALLQVPAQGKKVTCDMTFWNFKGKTYTVGRQYPPERLKADKIKGIDIKGEYAMENKPGKDHRVYFSTDKGGKFLIDVTFENASTGKVLGDGVWKIGQYKFGEFVHIPYGRVIGKIAYNEDTIAVKGYAYMDQVFQTTTANNIAIRSINFSTNASPLYAGRISISKDGKPFGYALYKDHKDFKIALPQMIKEGENHYNGKKFAKGNLIFQWTDGNIKDLQFNTQKTYQRASLLDKIDSWVARQAMKIVAGGEVLFYRGRDDMPNGKKLDWTITGVKD